MERAQGELGRTEGNDRGKKRTKWGEKGGSALPLSYIFAVSLNKHSLCYKIVFGYMPAVRKPW